ncbi:hypothetical protein CCR75_007444 [Bremia lactucae]|uniref:Uncharacterized protein n=1 Tax=Bremia lactucae TaxID=4779 RepID=A0A976NYI4_BRELC|nr:hypothetical protein CCR75_007444 [Bremia lactucae]
MRLWCAGVGKKPFTATCITRGPISNSTIRAFIDNDASFNAVDPRVIEDICLPFVECAKPLELSIGNNQQIIISQCVTQLRVKTHSGFPSTRPTRLL